MDNRTKYKNQAFFVCLKCATLELIKVIKKREIEITKTLQQYLRELLHKYRNVVEVINVFNPNYDFLVHPEATLINKKKKTPDSKRKNPT